MPPAPLRSNESDTLAALHRLDVLDSAAEAEFDALARAAAAVCETPIALVSLVDADRQWFKANVGLPDATETPRAAAFCAHTVLGSGLMEVPDTLADLRFVDNPLVTGAPDIRFYAGMPLRLSGGEQVGTLCVIDRQTRALSSVQREVLGHLAQAVSRALEGRRAERELGQARHDLHKILDAMPSQIGYWDLRLRNRIANQAYQSWFGVDPAQLQGRHMRELLGDALFERNRGRLEAALQGQPQHFYEQALASPTGHGQRHAQVSYLPDIVDGEVKGLYTLVHDITEGVETRRELAAAQRESEALLRTLQQHAIVSVADARGRIIEVNDNFCAISGYTRDELLGQDQGVLNADQHGRAYWLAMWQTISRGQAWRGEVCSQAKDGSLYWLNSLVAPVLGPDGEIQKYIAIRNDITPKMLAQQQAEQARLDAEEAERFLREVTDRLPLRVAYVDDQQRLRFVNEAHCRHFGRPRAQILGRTLDEMRGVPLPADIQAHVQATLQGHSSSYVIDKDGRSIEYQLVPDQAADGRVAGFFALGTDITERQATDTELRRTLTLLRSVLDASTQVSIIAVEPDGLVSIFNRGAEQLLGQTAAEVVGRARWQAFHDPDELTLRAQALTQQLGRPVSNSLALCQPELLNQASEWHYLRRDGSRVPVALAVTAMHDDHGALVGYVGVAHDISARLQYEVTLRDALFKAQSANQAKSRFLANMSHEIRTPMNAVIGLTYLLQRTPLNPEQADTLGKIKLAGQSLLAQINDVLDLSKIEASEMEIECAPFMLAPMLGELAGLARLQADGKAVRFELQVATGLPQALLGDATRLRQVLTNLLTNAIKFTAQGSVQLAVTLLQATAQHSRLRFEVRDSGVGIAADALPKLFVPFLQADSSTTRRFGGTGLGLSIVKQLVTLMGGELGVQSTPGVGSAFWVELDFALCDDATTASLQPADAPEAGPGLSGLRVLVTDDNPINLEVARRILALEGASVCMASNGQEAVDHLLANPQGVDVVLMDVQMPVLDGHDATRRIRSGLGLTALPIIALTAGITTGEHERARAAGMNDVVAKPFDPAALVRSIRRLVGTGSAGGTAGAGSMGDSGSAPSAAASPRPAADAAAQPLPPTWPRIDGIDGHDAHLRLGGDQALLRLLLRLLLDNFGDLGPGLAQDQAGADPARLAARLHDLKGSAGTLGARALAGLAARAEQACLACDRAALAALLPQLGSALAALRQAAAPLLQQDGVDAVPAAPAEAPLDGALLAELLDHLQRGDMAALDQFQALALPLRRALGPQRFGPLQAQIDRLAFSEAVLVLQALRPGEPLAPACSVAQSGASNR